MFKNKILILILLGGLIIRLIFLFIGVYDTLAADDAFYYFNIAKNIAQEQGATFDGLAKTNGFHPLWLIFLIPIYKFFGQTPWTPLYFAFLLIIILDLISGLLIYKIIKLISSRGAGLLGAFFWLFSPVSLFISAQAMEASLATLLALLSLYFIIKIYKNPSSNKLIFWLGISAGLMILARTDLILLFLILMAALLYLVIKKKLLFKKIIMLGLITLIVLTPWLIWNWFNFKSIWQVSAQTKMHIIENSRIYIAGYFPKKIFPQNNILDLSAGVYYINRLIARGIFGGLTYPGLARHYWLAAIILFLVFAIVLIERIICQIRSKGNLFKNLVFIIISIYFILHYIIFVYFIKSYWPWYFLTPFTLFSIITALSLKNIIFYKAKGIYIRGIIVFLILIIFLFIPTYTIFKVRPVRRLQKEYHFKSRLDWINENIEDDKTLGVFNAGEYGYFASYYTNCRVINLDLKVNNQGFKALKQSKYSDYVISNIDYLAEDPNYFYYFLNESEINSLMSNFKKLPFKPWVFYKNISKD